MYGHWKVLFPALKGRYIIHIWPEVRTVCPTWKWYVNMLQKYNSVKAHGRQDGRQDGRRRSPLHCRCQRRRRFLLRCGDSAASGRCLKAADWASDHESPTLQVDSWNAIDVARYRARMAASRSGGIGTYSSLPGWYQVPCWRTVCLFKLDRVANRVRLSGNAHCPQ